MFTPGIFLGGIIVLVVFLITGKTSQPWLWILAVGVSMLIDTVLYIRYRRVPDIRTRQVPFRDEPPL